jgi:hypothetical protein
VEVPMVGLTMIAGWFHVTVMPLPPGQTVLQTEPASVRTWATLFGLTVLLRRAAQTDAGLATPYCPGTARSTVRRKYAAGSRRSQHAW